MAKHRRRSKTGYWEQFKHWKRSNRKKSESQVFENHPAVGLVWTFLHLAGFCAVYGLMHVWSKPLRHDTRISHMARHISDLTWYCCNIIGPICIVAVLRIPWRIADGPSRTEIIIKGPFRIFVRPIAYLIDFIVMIAMIIGFVGAISVPLIPLASFPQNGGRTDAFQKLRWTWLTFAILVLLLAIVSFFKRHHNRYWQTLSSSPRNTNPNDKGTSSSRYRRWSESSDNQPRRKFATKQPPINDPPQQSRPTEHQWFRGQPSRDPDSNHHSGQPDFRRAKAQAQPDPYSPQNERPFGSTHDEPPQGNPNPEQKYFTHQWRPPGTTQHHPGGQDNVQQAELPVRLNSSQKQQTDEYDIQQPTTQVQRKAIPYHLGGHVDSQQAGAQLLPDPTQQQQRDEHVVQQPTRKVRRKATQYHLGGHVDSEQAGAQLLPDPNQQQQTDEYDVQQPTRQLRRKATQYHLGGHVGSQQAGAQLLPESNQMQQLDPYAMIPKQRPQSTQDQHDESEFDPATYYQPQSKLAQVVGRPDSPSNVLDLTTLSSVDQARYENPQSQMSGGLGKDPHASVAEKPAYTPWYNSSLQEGSSAEPTRQLSRETRYASLVLNSTDEQNSQYVMDTTFNFGFDLEEPQVLLNTGVYTADEPKNPTFIHSPRPQNNLETSKLRGQYPKVVSSDVQEHDQFNQYPGSNVYPDRQDIALPEGALLPQSNDARRHEQSKSSEFRQVASRGPGKRRYVIGSNPAVVDQVAPGPVDKKRHAYVEDDLASAVKDVAAARRDDDTPRRKSLMIHERKLHRSKRSARPSASASLVQKGAMHDTPEYGDPTDRTPWI